MGASSLIIYGSLFLLFALVIGFLVWKSVKSRTDDGGGGEGCDSPDCKNKDKDCTITSSDTLKHCTKDEDCYRCMGDMACRPSSSLDYHLSITQDKCIPPYYQWDHSTNSCVLIPGQQVCLPQDLDVNFKCNKYTGRKVLGKLGQDLPYQWMCICKDSTMFSNEEIGTDCSKIQLCGMQGESNESSKARHLVLAGTEKNPQSAKLWSPENDWSPLPPSLGGQGACICAPNEYADQVSMNCHSSQCGNGQPSRACGQQGKDCTCQCDAGFVDCADITFRNDPIFGKYTIGVCDVGMNPDGTIRYSTCVPDPCKMNPDDFNSKYDPGTRNCICPTGVPVQSDQVPTGQKCINLCENNGPCGKAGTDEQRGTCYIDDGKEHDELLVWKFLANSQENKIEYLIQNESTSAYFYTDNGKVRTSAKGGSAYYVVPVCAGTGANPDGTCKSPNNAPGVSQLHSNDKYRLVDVSSGMTIGMDDSGSLVTTSDQSKYITWTYISYKDSETNKGYISYGSEYVSATSASGFTDADLTTTGKWANSARCKDCILPAKQDGTGLCNKKPCLDDGRWCTDSSQCCNGNCHTCSFWESVKGCTQWCI